MDIGWPYFKELIDGTSPRYSYISSTTSYFVFLRDRDLSFSCVLNRDGGAHVNEFEGSYQPGATPFVSSAWNSFTNLTGNATTTVKSGPTVLVQIIINTNNTGGTVTIYDNTAASGTQVGRMQIGTPSGGVLSSSGLQSPGVYMYGIQLAIGLTITTAGSAGNNITVIYR